MSRKPPVIVRNTRPGDFEAVTALSRKVYPNSPPWKPVQLENHLRLFPEGQFVAEERGTGRLVGMCASLIVNWDDYDLNAAYNDFTAGGMFSNHDPDGRTLYAAEVMVDPEMRGRGVGKALYAARRELCRRLALRRIRAGARLRGYHRYADRMSAEQYTLKVIRGEIGDPTISFQLKQGFRVIGVVRNYFQNDPETLGYAAIIEWINHRVATREDYKRRDRRFAKPRKRRNDAPPTGPSDESGL